MKIELTMDELHLLVDLLLARNGGISHADKKLLDGILKRAAGITQKLDALDEQTPAVM